METVFTLVFTLLTLGGMMLAIKLTGSMFVGILAAIIVVMIWKSVQVPLLILWDKFAESLYGEEIGGLLPIQLGLRVLIITEFLDYSEETSHYFYKMIEASTAALKEEYPLFKLRWLAVRKRKSPIQYSNTLCGENGENISKCYKAWLKTEAVFKMTAREKNKDLFLYDGGIVVDDKIVNYTAMYLFDSTLPVTVAVLDNMKENEKAEETEEPKEEKTE
jgi:hypothetical protein